MRRRRLLDLFCCAGGAARGYADAGFDVVGVDIAPQPRYPFEFHQADALAFLREHAMEFDAIHASPPCQDHSSLSHVVGKHGTAHLLPETRAALAGIGLPYVIENVPGADMPGALVLCGTEFGLATRTQTGAFVYLRRHRLFESNVVLFGAGGCSCAGKPIIGVYGDGGVPADTGCGQAERRAVMGISWMTRRELSQAIPPAYTQFIGEQLLDHVERSEAA